MVTTDEEISRPTRRLVIAAPRPVRPSGRARVTPAVATDDSPTTSIHNVMLVFIIGASLALLFTARGLVHSGHGMDLGPKRAITLAVGGALLRAGDVFHLSAPFDAAEAMLGRGAGPASSPLLAGAPVATPLQGRHRSQHPMAVHRHRHLHYRLPTAAHPLQLLVTGDSLTEFMAPQLVNAATAIGPVRGWPDTHYGTGLVRPDFVDWSVLARQQVRQFHPDAVVVFMGGNDFQNIQMPNGVILQASSAPWTREYERRAAVCMRIWAQNGHARVYWLSMPPARSNAWSYNNAQIDLALRRAARQVPGARYLNILGPITIHGRYSDFVPYHGQQTLVREPDGIHLNETGSSIVASEVLATLTHDWHLGRRPVRASRRRAAPHR